MADIINITATITHQVLTTATVNDQHGITAMITQTTPYTATIRTLVAIDSEV
jgi:hypothetical protein